MDTGVDTCRKAFVFIDFFIGFSLYRLVHAAACGTDLQNQDRKNKKAATFGRSAHPLIKLSLAGKNYTVFSRRSRLRTARDYFASANSGS
jgi:hypothetical protein